MTKRSNVSFASLPLFLPTIISGLGTFGSAESNGLSAPPYLVSLLRNFRRTDDIAHNILQAAFFYILIVCYLSDHFKLRGPFCGLSGLIGAIGFIIQATTTSTGPRYFAAFLSVQIFASVALLLSWTSNIHATESRRAGGFTVLYTIGQCGTLLGKLAQPLLQEPWNTRIANTDTKAGTNVFPASEAPYYRKGMWISAAFCLLVFFLSICLSLWLIRENRKIERERVPGLEETEQARESGRNEKHRYIW